MSIVKTIIGILINNSLSIAQSSATPTPANWMADCDINTPCEMPVWIDTTKTPVRIILNVFSRAFQANSTGAASGGGSSPTTSGGSSHHHTFSTPNHAHHKSSTIQPWYTNQGGADNHTHSVSYTIIDSIDSSLDSDSGGTSASDTSHTHSVTISPHTHPMVFGIFKFGYFAPVQMRVGDPGYAPYNVFGTQGDESTSFQCTGLDITSLYSQTGGAGLLQPGMNFVYFTTQGTTNNPSGLLRIYAEVRIIYKG